MKRFAHSVKSVLAGLVLGVTCMFALAASADASVGITSFDGTVLQSNGDPAIQAGSHPANAAATFFVGTTVTPVGQELPTESIKDTVVDLPPGLIGNPRATPTCPIDLYSASTLSAGHRACPPETQVGFVQLWFAGSDVNGAVTAPGTYSPLYSPLYSVTPPHGSAALLGFYANTIPVTVEAKVRTGGDYGVRTAALNAPATLPVAGVTVTVWGVPADPSHDSLRGDCISTSTGTPKVGCSTASADAANPKAFFTLPTSCVGPVRTDFDLTTWQGGSYSSSFLSHDNTLPTPNPQGNEGCNALDFSPTLEARPTTNVADAPTGLNVDLHIPQETFEDPNGVAEANLKTTTVTLPDGFAINPSGANGLDGCSSAQVGLTSAPGVTPVT
jgi:hypothetical protein